MGTVRRHLLPSLSRILLLSALLSSRTAPVSAADLPASALAFSYPGRVDTDTPLADVVGGDFTLAVRFLPQYPFAYAGPFVAQTGPEPFFFGQGYFRGWERNPAALLDVALGRPQGLHGSAEVS